MTHTVTLTQQEATDIHDALFECEQEIETAAESGVLADEHDLKRMERLNILMSKFSRLIEPNF